MRNKDGLQLGDKGGITMWIGIRKAPDDPNMDAMKQQLKRLMQGSKAADMKQRIEHMLGMGMGQEQAEDMAQKYEEHLEKPIQARMEELRQTRPEMDEGRLRRLAEADIMTPGSPHRVASPKEAPQESEKIGEREQRPSLGRGQAPAPRGEFLQPLREGEDERRKKTVQLGTESGFGGFNKETILHDPTGQHPLFYGSPRKLQDAQAKHQQASQMAERLQPPIDRLETQILRLRSNKDEEGNERTPTPQELAQADQLDEVRFKLMNDLYPHTERMREAKAEMEKHGPQSHMSLEKYLGRMLSGASAGARDMQFGGQGRKGGVGLADFQQKILGQDVADVGRGSGGQQEMIDRMFELHRTDPLNLSSNVLNHLKTEGLAIDLERSPSMANLDIGEQTERQKKLIQYQMRSAQKQDDFLENLRGRYMANPTAENLQKIMDVDRKREELATEIRRLNARMESGHMSVMTPEILAERVFGQGRDMSKDPTIVRPGEGEDGMDMRMENALNNLVSRLGLEEAPANESDGERAMREQQLVSARKQFRDLIQQGMSLDEVNEQVRQTVEDSKTRFAGEAAPYGALSVLQPGQGLSEGKVRQDFPHAPQGEDYTLDDSDAPPVETPEKPSWMDSQKQGARDRRRFGDPFGDFGMQVPEKEEEDEDDDMKQAAFPMYIGDVLMKSVQNRLWWQGL
jgi:hypothetical protein